MKKIGFILLFIAFHLNAADINQQVDDALARERHKIFRLKLKLSDKSKHAPPSVKLRLSQAEIDYEVKSKLAGNYIGTEVIQNPEIQNQLLRLLNLENITTNDLIKFQKLVASEKSE